MQNLKQKKNWSLTPESFRGFLEWLGEGADSDGEKYLEMQRRLVAYFDRKNCFAPDDLADETLNRVARRLEEEGNIETETPAKYCYTVARFVFLEYLRGKEKQSVSLDDVLPKQAENNFNAFRQEEERKTKNARLNCLEECAGKLEPENRDLIMRYYFGEERVKIENRRALAERLEISSNALSIRACRIRDRLEACVKKCVGEL